MIQIRVAAIDDRQKIVSILAENGYTVTVIKKERTREYKHFDHFVAISGEPELPEYYENKAPHD